MQIIVNLLVVFLMTLFPYSYKEEKPFLKNFSIIYENKSFWMYFDEIDFAYERMYVYLNNILLRAYDNNQKVNKVELFNSLIKENNIVTFELSNNSINNYYSFGFTLKNDININNNGYFSFNSLVNDQDLLINFGEDQFVNVKNFTTENNSFNYRYLDLALIGNIDYDYNYTLCEKIELYIFNYKEIGLNDNVFELRLNKGNLYFVNEGEWNSTLIKDGKLYFPKSMNTKIIEMQITFKSIFLSPIDLNFNYYLNLKTSLIDMFDIKLSDQIIDDYEVVFEL